MRQRVDYITKEFYTYKNIQVPKHAGLENKLRTIDTKLGELNHHTTTSQEKLKDLQPLIELNYADTSKDLRECLINYVFEAWNKEYGETYSRKSEYMRMIET